MNWHKKCYMHGVGKCFVVSRVLSKSWLLQIMILKLFEWDLYFTNRGKSRFKLLIELHNMTSLNI